MARLISKGAIMSEMKSIIGSKVHNIFIERGWKIMVNWNKLNVQKYICQIEILSTTHFESHASF